MTDPTHIARPSGRQLVPASSGHRPQPGSWNELFSGRNAIYALALAGGVALHSVNMYIAITVMPSAIDDIGGLDFYAWTTTLFVLASILAAAVTAAFLQAAGPRYSYALAALLFCTGTLACAFAPDMPTMLAGRSVQGFGGGLLYALAYATTRQIFPQRLWARAIGLVSAMFGIATLIGPAIGGMFAQSGAWRAAFWSIAPVAILFAAIAVAALPKTGTDKNERAGLPGLQLVLLTAAVLSVSAGSLSAGIAWNLAGLAAAIMLIGLIAWTDARSRARLLPRRSFSVATPLGVLYATIALLMIGMQPEIFVPYLLQNLHEQSPLSAGYLAALMAFGWTAATLLSARWQNTSGDRLIVLGPALAAAGLALLALFLPRPSGGEATALAPVCAGLFLVGAGIGTAWPGLVTRVFRSAPADEQNLASSGMTTIQLFAIAFGTACAGMVANLAGIAAPGGTEGAAAAAFWLGAVFLLAPALAFVTAGRARRLTR